MPDRNDTFPFTEGDTVLVRVREHGTSGPLRAKFVAECVDIGTAAFTVSARFDLPFGTMNTVTLRPYEAEFETVAAPSEVTF